MGVEPIAVVGIGCRYPGARTPLELWENVLSRRRQFRRFPDCRLPLEDYYDPAPRTPDKTYADRGSFIDGFEFDWVGRRIPKRTFESTDVVHWLALDTALAALADAGHTKESIPTDRSAVLVGNSLTGEESRAWIMRLRWPYVRRVLRASADASGLTPAAALELEASMEEIYKSPFPPVNEDTLAGVLSNTIPGRICNFLDFKGGGYTVDGACASGMIAVATAANGLAQGELDFALAGGVDMSLDAIELVGFAMVGALTRDDMTVYDRRGSGFLPGEGCGFVALKRLADARRDGDSVYAVIRGWGISSDGSGGVTAPRADSQSTMLLRAYERAGYSPQELAFVEGHGTATVAGDKAELEGIQLALAAHGESEPRSVGMTSAKSLIGHTKAASGLLGLLKTVMAVNRRVVPPTAACRDPNPVFARTAHALYPIRRGEVREEPIRAGVSAMGFGGINCHVTLESGDPPSPKLEPVLGERALLASSQETELFVFAADSADALRARLLELLPVAEQASIAELLDLSALLAQETTGAVRAAVVAGSPEELADRLRAVTALLAESPPEAGAVLAAGPDAFVGNAAAPPRVGFLFPGQGSQQLDMGRTLVERFPWAAELGGVAGESLLGLVFRPLDRVPGDAKLTEWRAALSQTEVAQPAICFASLLWLERLRRIGVEPVAVGGHSLGELTALHAAGVYGSDTLMRLATERGAAMAAPAGEAGAMAALRCARDQAEALTARASGYAVVANVNAPEQTVVSGERAAIEEVIALAAAEGVDAVELPVSNAFHSRLVAAAADVLGTTSTVTGTIGTTAVPVISGLDGTTAPSERDVREHLALQLVSPVDFVALVHELASRCDVLVEVGPGRILSGLAGAIVGADGPPCLPVASEPERDRDLNALLGTLFVRGADLAWDALFEGRLVRPFVAASELRFFENPLERPFDLDLDHDRPATTHATNGRLAGALAATAGLAEADVAAYLSRRGGFLAQVIRADIESTGDALLPAPPQATVTPVPPVQSAAPDAAARLVALASELTGFPAETISLDARLLDDLNLDSIKAAELVVRAAEELGVATEGLEPAEFANATLGEVAALLSSTSSPPAHDALPLLVEAVVRATGFPAETVTSELRLLDDLNLDSIKAAEVVLEAAEALGIDSGTLDPAEFANATLGEVAAQLESGAPRGQAAGADALAGRASGTRTYIVDDVETAAREPTHDLEGAQALVLASESERQLADAIAAALRDASAEAAVRDFTDDLKLESFTHVVAVLPARPSLGDGPDDVIRRLRAAATPPGAAVVAFVSAGSAREPLARAFAASLHHERDDLRVRVVEGASADAVVAELTTPETFSVASYAAGRRAVPQPRAIERSQLRARERPLGPGDVVLVTGGARGITAECALGVARATGATLALAGRSAEEDAADTLERFASEGLTARYFRCDVTDAASVEALVAQVREQLGPIAAVVHGAGANVQRRIEQTSVDEAVAECAPKLAGALNLCRALAGSPPRLFVGLSSVTAVTGMPGNAWYGFANEALEAVLREFGAEHADTETLAVAFGIWQDVGMGARAGGHLERMGVATIPVEEGVRRFVELVEHDPGADRAVVTARLRGLDTWLPATPPLPAASRYLEEPVHVAPGVEVVARARISTDTDPELRDHVHRGNVLFPTVLGLEAMAQAVAWALGLHELGAVTIEDVALARPIVIEPGGTTIEVRAEVVEDAVPGRVRAAIGTEASGFTVDHFAATFVLAVPEAHAELPDVPSRPSSLVPARDLYGGLLFQGPAFQRLERVHRLDSAECLFELRAESTSYLLGDPFARDALLQATQLLVPQSLCLPVEIGALELHTSAREPGSFLARAVYDGRRDGHEHATITQVDDEGRTLERIRGMRARILETKPDNPTAEELADPGRNDAEELRRALAGHARSLGVQAPEVSLAHISGLHELAADERHAHELPLFEEVLARARGNGKDA